MNTTVRVKARETYKDWHVVDAAGRPLGRVATEVATLLMGKHKPTFEPHLDDGDYVIVVNAARVALTGRKQEQKTYYRHSGYPGGLRQRKLPEQQARFPDRVVRQAVWGMLPKGALGKAMLRHLKVYGGPDHPHQSQVTGSERARAGRDEAIFRDAPRLAALRGDRAVLEAGPPEAAEGAELEAEVAPGTSAPKPAEAAGPMETEARQEALEAEPPPRPRRTRTPKTAAAVATEPDSAPAAAEAVNTPAEIPDELAKPRRRRPRKAAAEPGPEAQASTATEE
jgi:large subunit ribosomal protein L13